MTGALLSTGVLERPVFFPAEGNNLFGVLTEPEGPGNGVGVLLIQGGDTVNVSLHRNRLAVRLARNLAADGYTCLRFDFHGLGESSGDIGTLHLHNPFTEDAVAAAEVLHQFGDRRPGAYRCLFQRPYRPLVSATHRRGPRRGHGHTAGWPGTGGTMPWPSGSRVSGRGRTTCRKAARLETLANLAGLRIARPTADSPVQASWGTPAGGRRPHPAMGEPDTPRPARHHGAERRSRARGVSATRTRSSVNGNGRPAGRLGSIFRARRRPDRGGRRPIRGGTRLPGVDVQDRFLALTTEWIGAKVPTAATERR